MRSFSKNVLLFLLLPLVACGEQVVGWALPDEVAPTIIDTTPIDGATEVAPNSAVVSTFSEEMDPITLNGSSFRLMAGTVPVQGGVTYAGRTAIFSPTEQLQHGVLYTATMTSGVADLAGNALASDYVWSFTTGAFVDTTRPTVTAVMPLTAATEVVRNTTVAATFSEPMKATTLTTATFTVMAGSVPVAGAVRFMEHAAIFTPNEQLALDTEYTATVKAGAADLADNELEADYVWTFTTGSIDDSTRPTIVATLPLAGAAEVARNATIAATFSEPMRATTLTTASFTVMAGSVPVAGVVAYGAQTAIFTPNEQLAFETEYTATVMADATDLAGNTLETDYVWTFTTGLDATPEAPSVVLTSPLDMAVDVALETDISATFSVDMDPMTLDDATFVVTGPGGLEVFGALAYDELSLTVVFTPDERLFEATTYVVTVAEVAAGVDGTHLYAPYVWSFTTLGWDAPTPAAVNLRSLESFVAVAGAGLTNSNSSGVTTLNGDVGLYPAATCMGDGSPCSALNPVVTGTLYAADPEGVALQAKTDLTAAYVEAMAYPIGTTVEDLTGMVLEPGVYSSASTMSVAVGGVVVLDGMGDPDAYWIFQIGSSLTVNNSAQIVLQNGAQAKNVFWAAFASSTIGSNVHFVGSVLAGASNSVETGSVVRGRLLCMDGQITLLSNTITLP